MPGGMEVAFPHFLYLQISHWIDGKRSRAKLHRRQFKNQTRRALGRAHLPPTKVFRWLGVNKTMPNQRVAAPTGSQYVYVGFSRRNKITISGKAIRFRHPDYNPDRAQKLISSFKSMHAFLSNLANRQTDRQTNTEVMTSTNRMNVDTVQHIVHDRRSDSMSLTL